MRKHLLQVLLTFTFVACSAAPDKDAATGSRAPRDEEYAVYSVLLNGMSGGPGQGASRQLLVINGQTSADKVTGRAPEEVLRSYEMPLPPALLAALRDYEVRNRQPRELTKSFALKSEHVLVSKSEFDAFFGGDTSRQKWEEYYREHPGATGYISLSRVGFSPDMTQAVVYVELLCGSLCADGSYAVLSMENGEWKEAKQIHFWAR